MSKGTDKPTHRFEIVSSSYLPSSSPFTSLSHSTRPTPSHSLTINPLAMSGNLLTPPPTPPHRSYLSLNSPPLSPPPESPLSTFHSYPPHLHPAYRSRCDSDKTLNNELLFEDKGLQKIGGQEKEVRVEVLLRIGLGETRESLQRKLELAFNAEKGWKEEDKGEVGKEAVAQKSEVEGEQENQDKIRDAEEELTTLRCRLKRAQQSIHDLRRNNASLKLQTSESLAISHQAEQDLERVLKGLNLTRGYAGGSRGGGGSWVVVVLLLFWVVFSKCC